MELIREGNDKKLEEVLEKRREAGERQDSEGNSPVNCAIREGKVKCLEVLMKAGIGGTDVDGTRMTRATTACEFGQSDCLEVLMKEGIDVTTKDGKGKTPAETAAANNQASCMLQLINATPEGAWQAGSAMLSNLTGHLTTSSHLSPRLQVWDKPVSVILKAEEKLWKLPFRRKKVWF